MVPAVEGTLNVLRAAKEAGGVRRVVVTSSISAIVPSPGWPAGEVRDERCWTDTDYCEKNGVSRPLGQSCFSISHFFRLLGIQDSVQIIMVPVFLAGLLLNDCFRVRVTFSVEF